MDEVVATIVAEPVPDGKPEATTVGPAVGLATTVTVKLVGVLVHEVVWQVAA